MKQLIVPVAIIIALIAFFIIIDRKEFSGNVQKIAHVLPAETKTVAEVKPAEIKTVETKSAAETKSVEAKPVVEETKTDNPTESKPMGAEMSEEKTKPAAVPVLTKEQADALVERMKQEEEDAKKRGCVFYEDCFSSARNTNASANIQQTDNWSYVQRNDSSNATSLAKKQDYFTIESEAPLEYSFLEPLLEHTIYTYTLCCSARGEGTIVLSQNGQKEKFKEFSINTKVFETVACVLGDGTSLNKTIVPTISFQGDLQIESITLYQKKIKEQRTICLGSIEDISSVPDITKSDYPDCYYTAKLVVKEILDGTPAPQNIQLLIPAFLDNKIDPLSTIMKKGNWKVSIRPFSLATKEEQEIEQVDEIEAYLYTPYILVAATTSDIPETNASGIPILEGNG